MSSRLVGLCVGAAMLVSAGFVFAEGEPKDWKIGIVITQNYEGKENVGVKVLEVIKDSPGAKIGLKPGDVIHSIDGVLFNDPRKVREDVMGKDRKKLTLVYQRGPTFLQQEVKIVVEEEERVVVVTDDSVRNDQGGGGGKKVVKVKVKKVTMIPVGKAKEVADPRKK